MRQQVLFTTYEAGVLENLFFLLFLAPQVSKRVDNDTEDEIEDNDDDDEEEQQIIDDTSKEQRLLTTEQITTSLSMIQRLQCTCQQVTTIINIIHHWKSTAIYFHTASSKRTFCCLSHCWIKSKEQSDITLDCTMQAEAVIAPICKKTTPVGAGANKCENFPGTDGRGEARRAEMRGPKGRERGWGCPLPTS